jgi:prepilin peptidase CpaA
VPLAVQILLAVILIPSAICDYRSRRVPNWITAPGLLAGIGMNVFLSGMEGLRLSLEGLGVAACIYGVLYVLRALGAGDAKLMMAVGAAVGPSHWLRIFLVTALLGGIVALTIVILRKRFARTLANLGTVLSSLIGGRAPYNQNPDLDVREATGARLPHAIVIACAALLYVVLIDQTALVFL